MHVLDEAPVHVPHAVLHGEHVLVALLAYVPAGHVLTHWPDDRNEPFGHDVQLVDDAPVHVEHEGEQLVHTFWPLTNWLLSQLLTHVVPCRYGAPDVGTQLVHWVALAPVHVEQAALQGEQVLVAVLA